MRKFVIGDIHGGYRALMQCIERSGFDAEKDMLISLGDVVDGWSETNKCIDYLITLKNHIAVRGNHDDWALGWMTLGQSPSIWVCQGGRATIDSYKNDCGYSIPDSHIKYLRGTTYYYINDNVLFVHAGFNYDIPFDNNREHNFLWDRKLFYDARTLKGQYGGFKEIFIGHSQTTGFSVEPIKFGNVWMLDQGAGWDGKLSIMDVDTHEFWQSDLVWKLYPECKGRGG